VAELVARSLELPLDVYLCFVEADIWPGEPQCFASPETKDEDQHVGRIQRILIATGGSQESPGFLD
jgi:type VI protein secretion system component VasK